MDHRTKRAAYHELSQERMQELAGMRQRLTVATFDEARDCIKPEFKPTVLKDGKVIYRARDGGVVVDEATAIRVQEVTEAATLLAFSLADERFRGKSLVVEGSDEFKL
jgi:hypothetical protein